MTNDERTTKTANAIKMTARKTCIYGFLYVFFAASYSMLPPTTSRSINAIRQIFIFTIQIFILLLLSSTTEFSTKAVRVLLSKKKIAAKRSNPTITSMP